MNRIQTLRTTAIQSSLIWEARAANLAHFDSLLHQQVNPDEVDLVVLPEMFTTGFTMNARQCADQPEGKTLTWLRKKALGFGAAITGSVIVEEDDRFFNRLYFVWPEGRFEVYDKRHTFSYAGEDRVFTKGNERLTVEYRGWKICPLICYDLRFPVWSRNTEDFDVLIYVANWPASRIDAWDTLLPARAVENMCYTIGVNRVGEDGNGIVYNGHSGIYDALGQKIGKSDEGEEGLINAELQKENLKIVRERFRFLDDRDDFLIRNI